MLRAHSALVVLATGAVLLGACGTDGSPQATGGSPTDPPSEASPRATPSPSSTASPSGAPTRPEQPSPTGVESPASPLPQLAGVGRRCGPVEGGANPDPPTYVRVAEGDVSCQAARRVVRRSFRAFQTEPGRGSGVEVGAWRCHTGNFSREHFFPTAAGVSCERGDALVLATDFRDCGGVSFEPQTDHGAFGIRAWEVGCRHAREVAGAVDGQIGDTYRTSGFTCETPAETQGEPLPTFDYTCRSDGARVHFNAS